MKCPHCGSTVEHAWILPFNPTPDPAPCEQFVKKVFGAVVKHYGEDEARRIFGPYGKQRTKRQIALEENAVLLGEYYLECVYAQQSNRRPNVRQLALRLAKESNDKDAVALERKIWRVIKSKKAHRYLREH